MALIPLQYLPGCCKVDTAYSNSVKGGSGRITDMNLARFVAGRPESIGVASWMNTVTIDNTEKDIITGIKDWRTTAGAVNVAYGNASHLYYQPLSSYISNFQIIMGTQVDITPLRSSLSSTLTNPFDMVSGSTTVTVHHTAHGLSTGDFVQLVTTTSFGGLTIAGVFAPITVTDANTYTIVNPTAATSSVNTGGGTVTYNYYRVTAANPFDTVISTPTVTVHHTAHGAVTGDYVTIANSSAVGGITPSGEYKITKVDANTYTITHGSNATSSVSGGGGSPNFRYNIATGAIAASTSSTPRTWSLDNYGQQLLACPYNDTIYIYDPTVGGRAYPMYGAPSNVLAMFVTPERFVFALGYTSNSMTVKWPDQTDYTQWTPTATNTANSRTLQKGAYLVGGCAVRDGTSLVYSNTTCYTFTYRGDTFVYADQAVGDNCGLPGQLAVTVMDEAAYWFSGREFFCWNGSLQKLQSDDIRDYVVGDFNNDSAIRTQFLTVAGAHSAKKEIWFGYASYSQVNATPAYLKANGRYVICHTDQPGVWSTGVAAITAWKDSSLIPCPIVATFPQTLSGTYSGTASILGMDFGLLNGGNDFNNYFSTSNSYIKASPMNISSGETSMDLLGFIPDMQGFLDSGGTITPIIPFNMRLTVYGQNYPYDTEVAYGPYSFDNTVQKIDLRIGARMVGYKIESTSAGGRFWSWRLGLPRIEAQPAAGRR